MFGQRIADARAAVERFLFELLEPSDEFFVLAFNHYPHILTPLDERARRQCGDALGRAEAVRRHGDLRRGRSARCR